LTDVAHDVHQWKHEDGRHDKDVRVIIWVTSNSVENLRLRTKHANDLPVDEIGFESVAVLGHSVEIAMNAPLIRVPGDVPIRPSEYLRSSFGAIALHMKYEHVQNQRS
jgi:hypothetical protein